MSSSKTHRFLAGSLLSALLVETLCGCASPLRDAQDLALSGQHDQAMVLLDQAVAKDPDNHALRAAQARERELGLAQLSYRAEAAHLSGQNDVASELLVRVEAVDPHNVRAAATRLEMKRDAQHAQLLADAERLLGTGHMAEANAKVQEVLLESPGLPAARAVQQRIADRTPLAPPPDVLGAAYQKPLTLEFRDAPLRAVFDSLARASGVNFIFDKEVKGDAKITIMLRDIGLDDAMRTILASQQLDRKVLNDKTVFIFPDTPAKQREHQELVTRSFYLSNADVKQAQTLVRTMAKSRDLFIDERLNLLIVRDTPEVMRLVERLIASIDLAEPEVVLDVQVMEVGTNLLNTLGLQWPASVNFGLPSATGALDLNTARSFTASVLNPALVAQILSNTGSTNLLANPKLRARNREKAKVQIGEKLPVFTTTSTINVGVSTTVTYIDTGLKLEVEPSVQLDGDVVMKVNLEVTNLIGSVTGPQGAIAYNVGTRNATTSLRVHDGETQMLAGLINDDDTKAIQGLPGLSELPILGRLFGVHTDTRTKTEIVLLITPRVVRNLGLPDASILTVDAGSDASPGAASMRLHTTAARVAIPMSGARGANRSTDAPAAPTALTALPSEQDTTPQAPAPGPAVVTLTTTHEVAVGETAVVTVQNQSSGTMKGTVVFDATQLQLASGENAGIEGQVAFQLAPHGQTVVTLRALPAAANLVSRVSVADMAYAGNGGEVLPVRVDGDGNISVHPKN